MHRSKHSKRKFNNILVREVMTKAAKSMDKDSYVCSAHFTVDNRLISARFLDGSEHLHFEE